MLGPAIALARSIRERGVKGTLTQLYLIGDVKFGDLKGSDRYGNKYYENVEYPFGQHRWVEYSNIHNYDSTMIQPEWHGWMHHMFDETPEQHAYPSVSATTSSSHAIYSTHLGLVSPDRNPEFASVDVSQYRQRGYKVGSLMIGKDDPELYYKQPGHTLSSFAKKGGSHQLVDNGPYAAVTKKEFIREVN